VSAISKRRKLVLDFDNRCPVKLGSAEQFPAQLVLKHEERSLPITIRNPNNDAGNGTYISNGGAVAGAFRSKTIFANFCSAGNATLIVNGGAGERGLIVGGKLKTTT